MFPSLKGTEFEDGIECAIRYIDKSAFLFKGDYYARINYHSKSLITDGYAYTCTRYPCFHGTVFKINGIDAAFASHIENEYYFFKGRDFVLIRHGPKDYNRGFMVNGRIGKIILEWPALGGILEF
jgi:hypothetical protein